MGLTLALSGLAASLLMGASVAANLALAQVLADHLLAAHALAAASSHE
jgi:hypothetical protein